MELKYLFLNSGVCEVLESNDCRTVDMVFSIIGAYIHHTSGFENNAIISGVHRMYFDMLF